MKLCIFTIVYNGMPFLQWQHECFKKLTCDWRWIVVEGTAQNNASTSWCKSQPAIPSRDGTLEFLQSIASDHRVMGFGGDWSSKDEMVNRVCEVILEPCVLMQIDVDELYNPRTLEKIVDLFSNDAGLGAIKMFCRYFVGPNLICEGQDCWSNNDYEWLRVWRFEPGMFFERHEPPVMNKILGRVMERAEASSHGLTFDHLAWVREPQVKFKSEFYGDIYSDAVQQWKSLQNNSVFPCKLSRFFPWVEGNSPMVIKV